MHDLVLRQPRHLDGHVGAVGADVGADLAHAGATQAAAVVAGVGRAGQGALSRVAPLGRDGGVLGREGVEVGAHHLAGHLLRVGDGLHEGRGAAAAVTGGPHARHARGAARGTAPAVEPHAGALVHAALDVLAHGAYHRSCGQLHELAGAARRAAAARVGLAQLHALAGEHAALDALGREQLAELHAVGERLGQLLLVGGHIAPGTAVDDAHVPHAWQALGHARRVHGGVARAHDGDLVAQGREVGSGLGVREELEHVVLDTVLEAHVARRPGAHAHHHVGVAPCLELGHVGHLAVELDPCAQREAERDVGVDVGRRDAELRDDVARHAAQRARALDDGHVGAGAREEERARKARRATTHDGHATVPRARQRHHGRGLEPREHLGKAAVGRHELALADLGALGLVEGALTLGAAGVRAEVAGDVGQRVSRHHHVEGVHEVALVDSVQVGGDVLLDGAARAAGRREAARERQRRGHLVGLGRLDGLSVERVGLDGVVERGHGRGVHVRLACGTREHARDLAEALVAAGLEHRGGHGDGPDARLVEAADIARIGTAGVGDAELARELLGDAAGEVDGERKERPPAHVHLLARQLACRHVHREGVRELHAKREAALGREGHEAAKHRHGVLPLQILAEVRVVEGHVVKAERVKARARVVVAQKRRVALDVGVEALLGDEVGGDALDLGRRAAVEGRLGHARRHVRRDGLDERLVHVREAPQIGERPALALGPDLGLARVLHALDVGVDLGALDALEVVAHAHVEDEAVRVAQAKLSGQKLARPPGANILAHGIGHGELGGPLAVVALVGRRDAGLGHTLGELLAIHHLHGLELEEARTRHVGGHDVLRELRVGAGGWAKRRLDALREDRLGATLVDVGLADAKDAAVLLVLAQDPVHQLGKRNRSHDVAHG